MGRWQPRVSPLVGVTGDLEHLVDDVVVVNGVTIAEGDVVAASAVSGRCRLADAALAAFPNVLGVALTAGTGNVGGTVTVRVLFAGRLDSGVGLTPNAPVYLSDVTPGLATSVYPGAAGSAALRIGFAYSATEWVLHLGEIFPLLGPDGGVLAPTYAFQDDPNTGFYSVGADQLGVAVGGGLRTTFNAGDVTLAVVALGATGTKTAPSYSFSGDPDTGMYSGGANTLAFSCGDTVLASLAAGTFTTGVAGYTTAWEHKGTFTSLVNVIEEGGATRTLAAGDTGKTIRCTAAGGCVVTIPDDDVLPIGFNCALIQEGAGAVTLAGEVGTTMRVPASAESTPPTTAEQWAMIGITMVASDTAVIYGNLLLA